MCMPQRFEARNPDNTYLRKKGRLKAGDTLRQTDLAATLDNIRQFGERGFYRGRVAKLIVAEMKRGGGVISLADLKAYVPYWRKPISGNYRGYKVVSAPPPSSGGIALMQLLKLAEKVDFPPLT